MHIRRYLDAVILVLFLAILTGYGIMEGRTLFDRNRMVQECVSAGAHLAGRSTKDEETIAAIDLCYKQGSNEDAYRHFSCSTTGFVWAMFADPGTNDGQSQQLKGCDKDATEADWTKTQGLAVAPSHEMFCALVQLASEKPKDEPAYLQAFLATGHMCRSLRASRSLEIDEPLATFVQSGVYDTSKDGPLKEIKVSDVEYRLASGYGFETIPDGKPNAGEPMLYKRVTSGADKLGGGYTCCGFRSATGLEKTLTWLGALGGFSGLLRAILFFIPPRDGQETDNCITRCCLAKPLPRAQAGSAGGVMLHSNPMVVRERSRSGTELSTT